MKLNELFLKSYLNGVSPVGFEYQLGGQQIWMDYIRKYTDSVELDNYGTAYGVTGDLDSDFRVVIEAHCDEISWFVNHIDSNGYIKVIRNGGSDAMIAPSMRANLWLEDGSCVKGIFGQAAIHIKYRKTKTTMDDIFIDVGAKSKAAVLKMGINIGTVVTFEGDFMKLGDDYYTGKALDNKLGGFIIAEVARRLKEEAISLPYKLYIVNSVQEEIGLKGAYMIANTIKPNVAIVTDVCHETSAPCYDSKIEGECVAGLGGVITRAPAVHNKVRELIISNAKKNNIKHQLSASATYTGTDTDEFAYSNGGVPSALISIPLKYMHTTVETAHKKDIKSVIDLIYTTLLNIEENHNFKYNN